MKGRLEWRCRRGSKELDLILSAFVNEQYHGLSETERRRFDCLLDSPDPQLADWLCHGAQPADPELAALVQRIRTAGRG